MKADLLELNLKAKLHSDYVKDRMSSVSNLLRIFWAPSKSLSHFFSSSLLSKIILFSRIWQHHSTTVAVPDDHSTVLTSPIFWGLLMQLDCAFTNRHSMMALLGW